MLVIKLFGGVSIERDGSAITGPFTQRHRVALLAMLAAAHPRGQARDRLAAYLWPERSGESSRNLLNQGVHALRKGLGEGTIVSAGDELRFEPGPVRCDVIDFESALEEADHRRAVSLYSGPFLEGVVLPDAVEFEHWVDQERERLRRACCGALEALAVEAEGDPAEAVRWWRQLAALEPYSARVAISLMEALEALGDRAAALAHAQVHAQLLEEEFDAEPNPDVMALAERLRTAPVARIEPGEGLGRSETEPPDESGLTEGVRFEAPAQSETGAGRPQATKPAERLDTPGEAVETVGSVPESTGARTWKRPWVPWAVAVVVAVGAVYGIDWGWMERDAAAPSGDGWTGGQRTIAVLPFANTSPDPEDVQWFVETVRGEISAHLEEVSTLTVRSPESARRVYGDGDRPLREIASELQVAAVLMGSVLVAGDRFRLTVRLVDAEGDTTLWQHRYEGAYRIGHEISAVIDAQADVAERVASGLGAEPTEAELARIEEEPTRNPQAWSLFHQGRFQESQTTPESLHRAVDLYGQAIDVEPGFGEPYAGIASAYLFLAQVERWPREEYVERVSAAAERALEIDSTLADPYRILGEIKYLSWNFSDAEADFKTALRLKPNEAMPHVIYSQFLNYVGRHEEAIVQILRARELDPIDPFITANVAGQYYLARRYEEAMAETVNALELDDQNWIALWIRGLIYAATGRYDQAIEELQLAVEFGGGTIEPLPHLAFAYAWAGRQSESQAVLSQMRDSAESGYLAPSHFAYPYAGLGDDDRAFEWLEKAYEDRDLFLVWTLGDPMMDSLRPDPRFQTLVQKTGLSDYIAAQ